MTAATASPKKQRTALTKLDSLIANIKERYDLKIDRESCENISGCGFRGENEALAIVASDILCREQPITLRGLMYQLVSKGWLPSTDHKHYARVGRLLTRLREAGVIPFSWIVDGVRSTQKPSSWSGLNEFAETVGNSYRLDFWARLPHHIHIIVEKDAVAGTIAPVTREYDISLSPIRGYSSLSFAHEIASSWKDIKKPVFVYFLGDFDPSGFDLQRDLYGKLRRYSKRYWYCEDSRDYKGPSSDEYHREVLHENCAMFRRVGVIESDFEEFNLLPLAVKKKDRRAAKFIEEHGERCAELDALPSTELRRRVRAIIESHITNRDEWDNLKRTEKLERESWKTFIDGMEGATK